MTLVIIGPVTEDLIITEDSKNHKIGGASYFQSFVFENFYPDYMAIINCSDVDINQFPNPKKVKIIKKDKTHFFVNEYPVSDNPDIRVQSSNFADIPITKDDLKDILPKDIDAFILNPLNNFDFPTETINYLKKFNSPIYISLQGFLRHPSEKLSEDVYSIDLKLTEDVEENISNINGLFLDENEAEILFENNDYNDFGIDEIIITDGSNGSRIIGDKKYSINAVKCDNIIDSTGCGDTYMAAYISKKLTSKSSLNSANFASKIASDKLNCLGPYKSDI